MLRAKELVTRYRADPRDRRARLWSNDVIAAVGKVASGEVVNVSAWKDSDKNGSLYRDYFPNARTYARTNWGGLISDPDATEYWLDLGEPLPENLRGSFDLVFNHTTLEHVFNMNQAVQNLCEMSRDAVLVVVPFSQREHGQDYGDYWRFTGASLRQMFQSHGLEEVFIVQSPYRYSAVYLVGLFARQPSAWSTLKEEFPSVHKVGQFVGQGGIGFRLYRTLASFTRRSASRSSSKDSS